MGCYGIGLGRLMGAIVEALADAKGLSWPQSVAPFDAHLMTLGHDEKVSDRAESLYRMLEERGISVLYDDRRQSAGVKFEDAELIGIPYALIVSEKTIAKGNVIEMERRDNGETRDVNDEEMFHILL